MRALAAMLSYTTVVKPESSRIEWFYDKLVQYKNYVPLERDIYDVVERVEWLKDNEDLSQQIAEEGNRLAKEVMSREGITSYFKKAFQRYKTLLVNEPIKVTLPISPYHNNRRNEFLEDVVSFLKVLLKK